MRSLMPFRYVSENVSRDFEAWRENRPRQEAAGDGQPSPRVDQATSLGHSPERVLAIAFDDDDPTVRGSAWETVAAMSKDASARTELIRLVRVALTARFRVHPSAVTDELASLWLNSVRDLVSRAENRTKTKAVLRLVLERAGGPDLAEMESSTEAALRFLQDTRPGRRVAAISVLHATSEGRGRGRLASLLVALILSDPEPGVRVTALGSYIQDHNKSKHPEAMGFLARVVSDESAPIPLRNTAYQGLYQVGNRPVKDWPITREVEGRFEFPKDVDWEFVGRCSSPV